MSASNASMKSSAQALAGRVLGRAGVLGASIALAFALPAIAEQPIELRPDAAGHAGVVTLGDLFDGAAGRAGRVVVGRAAAGTQAVLDAGDVQLAAHSAGLDWPNSAGQRQIIVMVLAEAASEDQRTEHRTHHASSRAQVLVYARNLNYGEVVQPSDLQWSDEAVAGPDAPFAADAVVGMATRGPMRAGAAVSTHDLTPAKVIRRDQMISVDYASDGISLSLSAKAMGDAAVGETVQVINLTSKKIIEAVATGPGHAAVGPGADAVQSPAGFRTASNP